LGGWIGGYGLLVNFANQSQPPIQPSNTVVAQQPDKGGGVINNAVIAGRTANLDAPSLLSVGSLQVWAESFTTTGSVAPGLPAPTTQVTKPGALVGSGGSATVTTVQASYSATTHTTPATVAIGTTPSIFQAVDAALESLTPSSIKKARV
jgi:hypothetical protein